ncbi:MAG: hypothetical protein Q4B58_07065 [Bacteroidales bacterium]|nr:hypothetical protein [Bacteroidales bacterium]
MKGFKSILVAGLSVASMSSVFAQDKVEGSMSVDLVSQYVWRGINCGDAAIQPGLGISWKGLSLGAWGSVGLASADDVKEFDLTLGYSVGGFNIGVTDYWFSAGLDELGRYFKYDAHSTNHIYEANVGYDFGPVAVQWYTNIAGNDGWNADGDRAYSSFVQFSAPFEFMTCNWDATVGIVPYETSFYGASGFAVTELGLKATKEFQVSDKITIPLYVGISANPCLQDCNFYAGVAFTPNF